MKTDPQLKNKRRRALITALAEAIAIEKVYTSTILTPSSLV